MIYSGTAVERWSLTGELSLSFTIIEKNIKNIILCWIPSHVGILGSDSVLLNRLGIGHTRLTHSFLLTGDDLPECGTCHSVTVKHILVECVDLKDVRNKHFVASSIKDLFDNIEAHKIINFIKETRFYKQL